MEEAGTFPMRYRVAILLLFFFFIAPSRGVVTRRYKLTPPITSDWKQYFHTKMNDVGWTRSTCFALTYASTTSDIFLVDNEECYMGKLFSSHTNTLLDAYNSVSPAVYSDEYAYDIVFNGEYILFRDVKESFIWSWFAPIQYDIPGTSGSATDCYDYCNANLDPKQCNFIVFESNRCHFGHNTADGPTNPHTGTTVLNPSAGLWNIFIRNGLGWDNFFERANYYSSYSNKVTLELAEDALWMPYLYEEFTNQSQLLCHTRCLFHGSNCEFVVHSNITGFCYMGKITTPIMPNVTLQGSPENYTIWGQATKSLYDNREAIILGATSRFSMVKDFIFHALENFGYSYNDGPSCALACTLNTTCQFAVWELPRCYFADYSTAVPLAINFTDDFSVDIYTSRDESRRSINNSEIYYFKLNVSSHSWRRQVRGYRLDISLESCADFCYTVSDSSWCELFSWHDNKCYWGSMEYTTGAEYPIDFPITEVYYRKGTESNFLREFKTDPMSSTWTRYFYRKVSIIYPEHDEFECSLHCLNEGHGVCEMHFLHNLDCYLGRWDVDSTRFDLSTLPGEVKYKHGYVTIISGGRKNVNESLSTSEILTDYYLRCSESIPSIPYLEGIYGHGFTYSNEHKILFTCGGFTSTNPEASSDCFELRMSSDFLTWDVMPSMPENRMLFPLIAWRDFIYAIGGSAFSNNSAASDTIDAYDIVLDIWTANVTQLPYSPLYGHCAVNHGDDIWVIGGREPNGDVVDRADIWNPDTNTWVYHGAIGGARYQHACGIWYNANNTDNDDETWIIIAGGYSSNTSNSYVPYIKYYNIITGGSWLKLFPTVSHRYGSFGSSANSVFTLSSTRFGMYSGYSWSNGRSTSNYFKFRWTVTLMYSYSSVMQSPREFAGYAIVPREDYPHCKFRLNTWQPLLDQVYTNSFASGVLSSGTDNNFIEMTDMELYRSCDGSFHFRLEWLNLRMRNEWVQSNDPTLSGPVTDYHPISLQFGTHFGGLQRYDQLNPGTSSTYLMTGDTRVPAGGGGGTETLGYGVGQIGSASTVEKIHGPIGQTGTEIMQDEIALYVHIDC